MSGESSWRAQVGEVQALDIKSVCLFPTAIDFEERKKLYQALDRTGVQEIPMLHLRHDMKIAELEYLTRRFKVSVFNIHPRSTRKYLRELSRYNKKVSVEILPSPKRLIEEDELKERAGIGLDTAHLEDIRLQQKDIYKYYIGLLTKYGSACAHISAVKGKPHRESMDGRKQAYDTHKYDSLREFDYAKKYKKYLPDIIALELENTIEDQLRVKKYLEKMLGYVRA